MKLHRKNYRNTTKGMTVGPAYEVSLDQTGIDELPYYLLVVFRQLSSI